MKYKIDFAISIRIIIFAYLIMSTLMFLTSTLDRNYFNLDLITTNELIFQIFFLILFTGILFVFRRNLYKDLMSLLIAFGILLFLLLFVLSAPAYSLLIGSFIVAIPPGYFTITHLLNKKKPSIKLERIISWANILIFCIILLFLIFGSGISFPEIPEINQSGISHDSFIYGNRETFFNLGLLILPFVLLLFFISHKKDIFGKNKAVSYILTGIVAILVIYEIVYMSRMAINHVRALYTATFDFGIFIQMFHNIVDGAGPVTTLERNQLLSHFAVHMSPTLYVLVPIFMIFPYPETLAALQIIVVGLGVIPLYLITKELKLNKFISLLIVIIYIFHPAIIGSSFYDFHENCFLAPLLLFTIYFLIKQKLVPLIISVVLTLMIKEDASIYLIFVGLYFIFGYPSVISEDRNRRKNLYFALGIILFSLMYFFAATTYLKYLGDGVMYWRYDNLNAYPDYGILGVVISVFQNPSFVLATMFSPEKVFSLLVILLLIGGVPLLSRNFSDYWLLVPMLLFNFVSSYVYQSNIGYQYFYGTVTLMIFFMVVTFKQRAKQSFIRIDFKKFNFIILFITLIIISGLGIAYMHTKDYVNGNYYNYLDRNIEMKEFLVSIEEEKSVLATGYLTTYMADVDVIYDIQFYNLDESPILFDYIILDLRVNLDRVETYTEKALNNGYVISDELSTEYLLVFVPSS